MSSAIQRMTNPKARVLVVEDDFDIRDALADALRGEGYEVMACTNGREAIDWLAEAPERPDVIVLDLMMPVMNGWQFLASCRCDANLAAIPVLVLSAHSSFEEIRAGAAACFRKPIRLDELLRAVERVV